jgi:beta-glucanase (GH16 family)
MRIFMSRSLTFVASTIAFSGCSSLTANTVGSSPSTTLTIPADYSLIWADEFDRNGLPDGNKWVYDTGMNRQGWHNHELQYYSQARLENSEAKDGKMFITARQEKLPTAADWGGQAYTSARLITAGKAQWTYGFFEIRAKMPCGRGTWPAIWMLNLSGEWPAGGELDIVEHVGARPNDVFSTVHTSSGSGGNGSGSNITLTDACTAFHTYQMDWTSTQIRFGVDGKVHHAYINQGKGTSQWPFDAPQFLLLNVAIGGDLGGSVDDSVFPRQMVVDYVRVYQKTLIDGFADRAHL